MNRREVLRSFASREAAVWLGTFSLAFAAAVLVLDAVGAQTIVVFVAGILFGEVADRAVGTYTDAYLERRDDAEGGRAGT